MKRSLMLLLEQPNSAVSIRAACLGLGAQDVTARLWNTSTKSHSPPAGRFVLRLHHLPDVPEECVHILAGWFDQQFPSIFA